MPKKPKIKAHLTIVREALDLSQSEFAARLGVSASIIKKVEEGRRPVSQDLATRIYAETGVLFLNGQKIENFCYTKADHDAWQQEVLFDTKSATVASRLILKLVELMLVAAARPGVKKSYPVFNALIQAVEHVKDEFRLEKHIEAEQRERHMTETRIYAVRELRASGQLAKMVGFKDDSRLKDDDSLPLTKTTGWLPAKDIFNIWLQHQELLKEILSGQGDSLTDKQKKKLAEMEKQIEREMDNFLPPGSLTK